MQTSPGATKVEGGNLFPAPTSARNCDVKSQKRHMYRVFFRHNVYTICTMFKIRLSDKNSWCCLERGTERGETVRPNTVCLESGNSNGGFLLTLVPALKIKIVDFLRERPKELSDRPSVDSPNSAPPATQCRHLGVRHGKRNLSAPIYVRPLVAFGMLAKRYHS